MTQVFIFGLLALSVDLLLGHTGLFSCATIVLLGCRLYHRDPACPVRYADGDRRTGRFLAGTLLGLLFGLSVRTRGVYFILVTLAMGYVIWGVGYRWASFTGGDSGINVPAPSFGPLSFASPTSYYYLVLCRPARLHLDLQPNHPLAVRPVAARHQDRETRMRSLGFIPVRHLYVAFVMSSMIASLAGVLYVYFNKFVNPVSASLHVSVEVVLMAIVGGTGTILGPILGAAVILGLRNWVSTFFELHLAVMGLVFIAVVIWAPGGVIGVIARLSRKSGGEPR